MRHTYAHNDDRHKVMPCRYLLRGAYCFEAYAIHAVSLRGQSVADAPEEVSLVELTYGAAFYVEAALVVNRFGPKALKCCEVAV